MAEILKESRMFRVTFLCDDKKLAEALRGLTGLAAGSPDVQPVVNATLKNGGSDDAVTLFTQYLKEHKLKILTAADMKAFCKYAGRSPNSHSYFGRQFVGAGLLKRSGKGANINYTVKA
jgi:hypothetical protein